ncbi:MAG: helix-turn-helix domain-containing protein [Bacteroidaceae bacterium]|nr:helix-turn-helix domain-containing protein [Bacteroidaceae bacterium]
MSTIGEEIKNRRKELQISQQDIADLAGIGINTLVAIERGTGNPSLKTLTAVLDAL